MPFHDSKPITGPLALANGFDLNPEKPDPEGSLMGAAFRLENPIVSGLSSFEYDDNAPFDPTYRPFDDIQGTEFEPYWERFVEARNPDEASRMKAQIGRELEDRKVIEAAGAWGFVAEMGAALLSPTTILPGGAIVKGTKGVSVGKTAMNVAGANAVAVAIDEVALQATQDTRTGMESATAIGGGVILGGLLGGFAGTLSRKAHMQTSTAIEALPDAIREFDEVARSLSAADPRADMTVRGFIEKMNNVPVLRGVVRSDPLLRGMLSSNTEARRAVAQLAETPLQYKANEEGQVVADQSVENRIKTRRNTELASSFSMLSRAYAEFVNDGPVGTIGRVTAPVTGRWQHLMGHEGKLTRDQFMNEVGIAAISSDTHPIPQVAKAAQEIRRSIFDRAKQEAIDVGIFDPDLQLKNGESYFMRNYNVEKIVANQGTGGPDDISALLREEFSKKRAEAKVRLESDKTVEDLEAKLADLKEQSGKAKSALERAQKKAKLARNSDEYHAAMDDLEIEASIEDAINSILGLKPGEHSYRAALSSPTRARALDVATEKLTPWLETDMSIVMSRYHNAIVPDIEIIRTFGDIDMTEAKRKIIDEKDRLIRESKSAKARQKHVDEAENRIRELDAMRDRIRGTFGVPENPKDIIVRAGRAMRTLSYTGYLGGMTLSAIPDVANVIGRSGVEAAFGSISAMTDPRRLGVAVKDAQELGAAAEWWLNSRAMSIADVTDEYGQNSKFERGIGATGRAFGVATGMIPWNAGWKSMGGAMISSKMSKAAVRIAEGKETKKDKLFMSSARIDMATATRIGNQIKKHGDMDGQLWLPQAGKWTDKGAFDAFRNAFNSEVDLMVITPGQDKPLMFSSEVGKFFSQFKSFMVSAHHRILISGLQRADAAVLGQVVSAIILGGIVSNLKADMGGYDRKKGAAFWEDAIDRSGLSGWLMEAHAMANGFTGGALSVSGEEVSRFKSRSQINGLLGPSVDMTAGMYEGVSAAARGELSSRDARKILRPVPGTNLPYILGLTKTVADAMAEAR